MLGSTAIGTGGGHTAPNEPSAPSEADRHGWLGGAARESVAAAGGDSERAGEAGVGSTKARPRRAVATGIAATELRTEQAPGGPGLAPAPRAGDRKRRGTALSPFGAAAGGGLPPARPATVLSRAPEANGRTPNPAALTVVKALVLAVEPCLACS